MQERGLYFFDTAGRDPQYQDLVEFTEPFPYNKGAKLGALVEAKVGQGRWLYVGLGLWRQLPAGTDGAFRLMANLLSPGASAAQRLTVLVGRLLHSRAFTVIRTVEVTIRPTSIAEEQHARAHPSTHGIWGQSR